MKRKQSTNFRFSRFFAHTARLMAARKLEKTITEVNAIFRNRDENNFINLSALRRLIAPNDKRHTAYLLSGNVKLKDVLVRLQKNDEDTVRDNGQRVIIHPELALEFIETKRPELTDVVEQWRHVIGSQPTPFEGHGHT